MANMLPLFVILLPRDVSCIQKLILVIKELEVTIARLSSATARSDATCQTKRALKLSVASQCNLLAVQTDYKNALANAENTSPS